jgi:hypothetical protein
LLLMAVTRRREKEEMPRYDQQRYDERRYADWRYSDRMDPRRVAPPVVIVTPGNAASQQLSYPASFPYQATQPQSQRQFRVMGHDEAESAGAPAANAAWQG